MWPSTHNVAGNIWAGERESKRDSFNKEKRDLPTSCQQPIHNKWGYETTKHAFFSYIYMHDWNHSLKLFFISLYDQKYMTKRKIWVVKHRHNKRCPTMITSRNVMRRKVASMPGLSFFLQSKPQIFSLCSFYLLIDFMTRDYMLILMQVVGLVLLLLLLWDLWELLGWCLLLLLLVYIHFNIKFIGKKPLVSWLLLYEIDKSRKIWCKKNENGID